MVLSDPTPTIRNELRPGDLGAIVELHGRLYSAEQGWNEKFEAYVAGPLSEFILRQTSRERIWVVDHQSNVSGSIAIVESTDSIAMLRWFVLVPELRGRGLGQRLCEEAIRFAKDSGFNCIELWTVAELEAAGRLYRKLGFEIMLEQVHSDWGKQVTERKLVLSF